MKTTIILVFIFSILETAAQNPKFDYFGLPSPGKKIELFAPGIISQDDSKAYSLAISPRGDEVFFSRGTWPECKVMHLTKVGGEWSRPEVAPFSEDCYATEPAFSPDGQYLYYSSSRGMADIKQYSIWRAERADGSWGHATKVIDIAAPDTWEFHPSITNHGTVYFCAWDSQTNTGSIYKSEYLNGIYSAPQKDNTFPQEDISAINPFIRPDGRLMIISAQIPDSPSKYDVFISRLRNGKWTTLESPGKELITPDDDDSFDMSPDGDFLFIYKQGSVYWTETPKGMR